MQKEEEKKGLGTMLDTLAVGTYLVLSNFLHLGKKSISS
jgi:hypothetical protein